MPWLKGRYLLVLMKAVRMHEYGSPNVLKYEDAPRPIPGNEEVLIRVHAAALNPLDYKIRSGDFQLDASNPLPVILGFDVAGVVEAIGEGVSDFAIGDEVYAAHQLGCHAEYVAVPVVDVAHKPHTLDFVQAAATPVGAVTAWKALEAAHLQAGQTLLIHGAAGGVGHFAVQLAKWRGAKVIGSASTHNQAYLHQLGVDEAIDYTTTPFEQVGKVVDVILDTVGGETLHRSYAVVKSGGLLLSIADVPSPEMAARYNVSAGEMDDIWPVGAHLAEIARLIDAGQLRPTIATVLPLHEARQAHITLDRRRTCGKIVLQVIS
jgi:NADPH:quinone reductase-like Zn-dependent oxidoreductase